MSRIINPSSKPSRTVSAVTTHYALSEEDRGIFRDLLGKVIGKQATGRFTLSLGQGAVHNAELLEVGESLAVP